MVCNKDALKGRETSIHASWLDHVVVVPAGMGAVAVADSPSSPPIPDLEVLLGIPNSTLPRIPADGLFGVDNAGFLPAAQLAAFDAQQHYPQELQLYEQQQLRQKLPPMGLGAMHGLAEPQTHQEQWPPPAALASQHRWLPPGTHECSPRHLAEAVMASQVPQPTLHHGSGTHHSGVSAAADDCSAQQHRVLHTAAPLPTGSCSGANGGSPSGSGASVGTAGAGDAHGTPVPQLHSSNRTQAAGAAQLRAHAVNCGSGRGSRTRPQPDGGRGSRKRPRPGNAGGGCSDEEDDGRSGIRKSKWVDATRKHRQRQEVMFFSIPVCSFAICAATGAVDVYATATSPQLHQHSVSSDSPMHNLLQ